MSRLWSQIEYEAIVRDYFAMWLRELSSQPYVKSEHRRNLQRLLDNRSDGAIEYKHQNISAVLISLGYPYLKGYKPAWNYQELLRDVVGAHILSMGKVLEDSVRSLADSLPESAAGFDWTSVLEEPPVPEQHSIREQAKLYLPRCINFVEREARNRRLGELGETFVWSTRNVDSTRWAARIYVGR